MKLSQLIERLQHVAEENKSDPEVRLMMQPSYPFEHSINGVCQRKDFEEEGDDRPDSIQEPTDVFICEGHQLRYGDKDAWTVVQ